MELINDRFCALQIFPRDPRCVFAEDRFRWNAVSDGVALGDEGFRGVAHLGPTSSKNQGFDTTRLKQPDGMRDSLFENWRRLLAPCCRPQDDGGICRLLIGGETADLQTKPRVACQ